jgi:hypothetical protein
MTLEYFGNTKMEELTDLFSEEKRTRDLLSQEIQQNNQEKKDNEKIFPNQIETYWDSWDRTDKYYPEGKIPKTAIREISGRKYMLDIGLTFALTKPGDTRDGVSAEVGQTNPAGRDFSHLKPGKSKYQSINIPAKYFPANRWIPMPLKAEQRILTPEQFLNYASQAIDEMIEGKTERDNPYAKQVKLLVDKIGKKELMCLMMATAKQESGGAPLGQFVFHRWEASRNDFSHTIFHIMLEGAGLEARRKLGMTPGQMNHPKNSCKMFLAFTIEKHLGRYKGTIAPSAEKTADFIYKKYQNPEHWITFYNGGGWENYNPDYKENLIKYTKEAIQTFENPQTAKDYAKREKIHNQEGRKEQSKEDRKILLGQELENALENNRQKSEKKFIRHLSEAEKHQLVLATEDLLQELSPNDPSFSSGDSLRVTADNTRIFIRIHRTTDSDWWGPRTIPRTTLTSSIAEKTSSISSDSIKPTKEEPPERLSESEYKNIIETEIRARLRGNILRIGEKNITPADVSEKEMGRAVNQVVTYLKQVAPNESFNTEKHDIIVTADDTYIYLRIQRESDKSFVGNGATKIPRDKE